MLEAILALVVIGGFFVIRAVAASRPSTPQSHRSHEAAIVATPSPGTEFAKSVAARGAGACARARPTTSAITR